MRSWSFRVATYKGVSTNGPRNLGAPLANGRMCRPPVGSYQQILSSERKFSKIRGPQKFPREGSQAKEHGANVHVLQHSAGAGASWKLVQSRHVPEHEINQFCLATVIGF